MCGHTTHIRPPLICVAIDKLDISAPINYAIGPLLHFLANILRKIKNWILLLVLQKFCRKMASRMIYDKREEREKRKKNSTFNSSSKA